MLRKIGAGGLDDLFSGIPKDVRLDRPLRLPGPMGELELSAAADALGRLNRSTRDLVCFLGAGAYDHFIPAVVDSLAGRSEFVTAYTPYQAEASQGTLQLLYEYQSMMTSLTGLDVTNANNEIAGFTIQSTKTSALYYSNHWYKSGKVWTTALQTLS